MYANVQEATPDSWRHISPRLLITHLALARHMGCRTSTVPQRKVGGVQK